MGSLQSVNMETLLRHTFVPDYSVRAVTEVLYIKIKRSLYMAALRATLMERSQKGDITGGEQFDEEVEKVCFFEFHSGLFIYIFFFQNGGASCATKQYLFKCYSLLCSKPYPYFLTAFFSSKFCINFILIQNLSFQNHF